MPMVIAPSWRLGRQAAGLKTLFSLHSSAAASHLHRQRTRESGGGASGAHLGEVPDEDLGAHLPHRGPSLAHVVRRLDLKINTSKLERPIVVIIFSYFSSQNHLGYIS